MLQLVTIPCLKDNYAFLIHDDVSGATAVIDVPEADPILKELDARGWALSHVLLTHHHSDHVDGLAGLALGPDVAVIGAAADAHRLPPLTRTVMPGERFSLGSADAEVIDVSGHTVGHIAFWFPEDGFLFTGDSLMAMGCGRLFEGSPAQMWDSLSRLMDLPGDAVVCSGHEYTESNARFARSLDEPPALTERLDRIARARSAGLPTVPSILSEEIATNPMLRARDPAMKAALGMEGAPDAEVFTKIRALKDNF
ncbi:hydroxyacylglutathione hydrolase [Gemmobacter serpentinus]|uniref:hydroxyacylglutathione hydrolase n=1 Tax=Gemmobacter serpentinus TaxID=2652247 RepID=UPI00124DF02B|nr:hydroxyacylglutathione hydrolase [Gemmobacter serpentinus]